MIKRVSISIAVLTVVVVMYSLFVKYPRLISANNTFDLDSIKKRGKLIALTDFNSTDYFIYKGEPMGFTYELLSLFADHIGVPLEIITENNPDKAVELLKAGKADILATGLPINGVLTDVQFCVPVDETRKVLVKRKNGVKPEKGPRYRNQVREQTGLGKNTLYVQTGYTDYQSVLPVIQELGDTVSILDVPYEPEKLIRLVAEGVIDYTICDENLAIVNSTYYPGIDINTPAGPKEQVAWAVKSNSGNLFTELNNWISSYRNTADFALLYAEYFRNSRSGIIIKSNYYAINTGRISGYDEIIRKYSAGSGWDWRLVASIICQESRFDPSVQSGAGAYGLMQIMPETAERYGIDITASPDSNIIAGMKYLNSLYKIFVKKIPDEKERVKFILASYNAGPGHVLDAMKLAQKNGMDSSKWDGNVAFWLLKKSEREHYTDSVVSHGYFKGVESVHFVSQVIDRYNHYRNIVPEKWRR
ncbi:MAG TPA: transglycosylase SLT domain-containing protein [Bacteroidales bacterium]|nr:transglycosylase SLT domain-containing protein [Bacteroidales bacterium]